MFRFDPNFDENELLWEQIKKEILGDDDDEDDEEEGEGEDGEGGGQGSSSCYYVSETSLYLHIYWVVMFHQLIQSSSTYSIYYKNSMYNINLIQSYISKMCNINSIQSHRRGRREGRARVRPWWGQSA